MSTSLRPDPNHPAARQLRELTASSEENERVPRPEAQELSFPPELRTAAITPRWSIVWTLTRDRVSSHSFFVALYAREVARIIDWGGSAEALLMYALTHDLEETITGDITGPAKAHIVDQERFDAYVEQQMELRMPHVQRTVAALLGDLEHADEVYRIVAAADKLDALLFLTVERRLGNAVVEQLISKEEVRLREAWWNLPLHPYDARTLRELWDRYVQPSIRAHGSAGGFGV